MPHLTFDDVSKSFGDTQVLQPFNAEIDDGEFLVLLGPSGCGKSTLLRMIAGLTDITSGQLRFDDTVVNDLDVRKREIAFVFQSYALYPQMTVRQNIAFPLVMDRMKTWQHLPLLASAVRARLVRSEAIAGRVDSIAEQLGLTALLDRRPGALSGGQRQRVALARSLVRNPSLYLLDEPLSNLDAKLRTQMRTDITALHRTVGKTFIYVTHDQIEAMTMATRIVVMNHGEIQQIGTPDEIYDRPRNTFVATFVGSPPMNLLPAAAVQAHQSVPTGGMPDGDVIVGIRPEHVRLAAPQYGGIPAQVDAVERVGAESIAALSVAGVDVPVFARIAHNGDFRTGDRCTISFDPAHVSLFAADTGERMELAVVAAA